MWPSVSCVGGSVFQFCCSCLRFCAGRWVVSTVRVFPSLCFTGADPETEHFRRQPSSTCVVTEYAATYIGGNAGLPIGIVHSTIPLSFLTFVHSPRIGLATGLLENGNDTAACGHPFSQFFGTSRHHVLFSTEPDARRHFRHCDDGPRSLW